MRRLLPPAPNPRQGRGKKAKPAPSVSTVKNPPRSVFDTEDFSASRTSRRIELELDPAPFQIEEALERTAHIDIETFKKVWEETVNDNGEVSAGVARNYAVLDMINSLQEEIRSNQIDPNVELISPAFDTYINILGTLSMLNHLAPIMIPDAEFRVLVMKLIAESVIEKAKPGSLTSPSVRDLLGKLRRTDNDQVEGDPYGLGVVQPARR